MRITLSPSQYLKFLPGACCPLSHSASAVSPWWWTCMHPVVLQQGYFCCGTRNLNSQAQDFCACLFLDASTVLWELDFPPRLLNIIRRFTWNSKTCIFLSSIFLTSKKKLKRIMQDLHGKWLNSAVNLSEMLQTGCCLFYDRVWVFMSVKDLLLYAYSCFRAIDAACVFFTRAAIKKKKKNQSQEQTLPQVSSLLPVSSRLPPLEMAPSAVEQLTTFPAGHARGGDEMIIHKRQTFIAC